MTTIGHLVRRFVWTIRAKPLSPREQAEADGLLREVERPLFWGQPFVDQRHGLQGARRVLAAQPGARSVARAALLHDVGKRHAGLGTMRRSLASGFRLFGLRPPWWRSYYDHGRIGSRELAELAAEELVIEWARVHADGPRPSTITAEEWAALKAADRA